MLFLASRFKTLCPDLSQKPGQNNRDGTRARIRESGRLSRPDVPSRFALSLSRSESL
jgi:hypothetical protein